METTASSSQTFRKPERLVSQAAFERLLKDGETFHQFPVRVIWKQLPLPTTFPVQVAFSVPKRNFKRAVDRNRIKRLLRESYRKNKGQLYALLQGDGKQYAVLLVYTGRKLPSFTEVNDRVCSILNHLAQTHTKTAG